MYFILNSVPDPSGCGFGLDLDSFGSGDPDPVRQMNHKKYETEICFEMQALIFGGLHASVI
jgi:hypothetical protein